MCFNVKQSTEFKTFVPPIISTKPSLVQLPMSQVSTEYEDNLIPLKPPHETTLPLIESEVSTEFKDLDDNFVDILFANMASLEHHEKEDLVDMEDDEITELWHTIHGDKTPTAGSKTSIVQVEGQAKQQNKVKKTLSKAEVIARGPKILFKKKPMQRVYTAKSA